MKERVDMGSVGVGGVYRVSMALWIRTWIFLSVFVLVFAFFGCKKTSSSGYKLQTDGGQEYGFTDLPGFFVEWGVRAPSEESLSQSGKVQSSSEINIAPLCSGAHIGGGLVITAAHCLGGYALSQSSPTALMVRYLARSDRKLVAHTVPVTALVIHDHFLHSHLAYTKYSQGLQLMAFDLAVLKTEPPHDLPYAAQAVLPSSLPQPGGALELLQYGIGREREEFSGVELSPSRYFGGPVAVLQDPQGKEIAYSLHGPKELLQFFDMMTQVQGGDHSHVVREDVDIDAPFRTHFALPPGNTGPKIQAYLATDFAAIARLSLAEQKVKNAELYAQINENIYDYIFITEGGDGSDSRIKGVCKGDSGGPLLKQHGEGFYELIGVASHEAPSTNREQMSVGFEERKRGKVCSKYGANVRVAKHLDWIQRAKASLAAGKHAVKGYEAVTEQSSYRLD